MRAALAGKSERLAPDALFGECRRLALAHVAAGTEDAPSWTALRAAVIGRLDVRWSIIEVPRNAHPSTSAAQGAKRRARSM